MSTSQVSLETAAIPPLLQTLRSAILLKDARIERLEGENGRLVERLARIENADAVVTALPPPRAPEDRLAESSAAERLSRGPAVNVLSPSFLKGADVRLVAKGVGVYTDGWAEPEVRIRLISKRSLTECVLSLWFAEEAEGLTADVSIFLNGLTHRARLPLGVLSKIKFPFSIDAGKTFELQITTDHVVRPPLPDIRRLSYIIHAVDFS